MASLYQSGSLAIGFPFRLFRRAASVRLLTLVGGAAKRLAQPHGGREYRRAVADSTYRRLAGTSTLMPRPSILPVGGAASAPARPGARQASVCVRRRLRRHTSRLR